MAFRFCDSFDHYATVDIPKKWTNFFAAAVAATSGRRGGGAMLLGGSGLVAAATMSKTLDFQTTWICGWAMNVQPAASGSYGGGGIYQLINNGTMLMTVQVDADSTISLITNNGTVYGNTGTGSPAYTVPLNSWIYIEIQNILTASGGTVWVQSILRVNGVTLLNTASANTGVAVTSLISQAANANRHFWSGNISSPGIYIDDLYIFDNQGANNTSFAGDLALGAIVADADTATLGMSLFPTTPTTHFTHVDEIPADGDTSYVFSNTPATADDYDWQPIASFAGTLPFVQYLWYARKDDEGSRSIQHTVGNTTYPPGTGGVYGTPQYSLCDSYLYYAIPLDVNPAAGAGWTTTNFNSQDFGEKVST